MFAYALVDAGERVHQMQRVSAFCSVALALFAAGPFRLRLPVWLFLVNLIFNFNLTPALTHETTKRLKDFLKWSCFSSFAYSSIGVKLEIINLRKFQQGNSFSSWPSTSLDPDHAGSLTAQFAYRLLLATSLFPAKQRQSH